MPTPKPTPTPTPTPTPRRVPLGLCRNLQLSLSVNGQPIGAGIPWSTAGPDGRGLQ